MLPFSIMFSDAQVLPFWTVIYTFVAAVLIGGANVLVDFFVTTGKSL